MKRKMISISFPVLPSGVFFAHSLLSLLGKDPAHNFRSPEFLHALPCTSCSLRLL